MSDYVTFEVTGLKEMEAKLLQLPSKIAKRILGQATYAGSKLIETAARGKAPVGTRTYKRKGRIHHPGYLRKYGIVSKRLKAKDWSAVIFGLKPSKRGFYAKWIERGKSKKHHYDPHPFVVPLLEPMKEQIANAIKNKLGARLDEVIRETPGLIKS